jgi:hypothetical protein
MSRTADPIRAQTARAEKQSIKFGGVYNSMTSIGEDSFVPIQSSLQKRQVQQGIKGANVYKNCSRPMRPGRMVPLSWNP